MHTKSLLNAIKSMSSLPLPMFPENPENNLEGGNIPPLLRTKPG